MRRSMSNRKPRDTFRALFKGSKIMPFRSFYREYFKLFRDIKNVVYEHNTQPICQIPTGRTHHTIKRKYLSDIEETK